MEQEVAEIAEFFNDSFSASSASSCSTDFIPRREQKMHPLYEKASDITGEIIAAAIGVHKTMGPGLIESIYEWCLTKELELRGFHVTNQNTITKAKLLSYMKLLDVPLGLVSTFTSKG